MVWRWSLIEITKHTQNNRSKRVAIDTAANLQKRAHSDDAMAAARKRVRSEPGVLQARNAQVLEHVTTQARRKPREKTNWDKEGRQARVVDPKQKAGPAAPAAED